MRRFATTFFLSLFLASIAVSAAGQMPTTMPTLNSLQGTGTLPP